MTAVDLHKDALGQAVAAGAKAASSARECAVQADIFLTSLPRPDHVETVMAGENGALRSLRKGSIWVDLTTNLNELVFRLAGEAP